MWGIPQTEDGRYDDVQGGTLPTSRPSGTDYHEACHTTTDTCLDGVGSWGEGQGVWPMRFFKGRWTTCNIDGSLPAPVPVRQSIFVSLVVWGKRTPEDQATSEVSWSERSSTWSLLRGRDWKSCIQNPVLGLFEESLPLENRGLGDSQDTFIGSETLRLSWVGVWGLNHGSGVPVLWTPSVGTGPLLSAEERGSPAGRENLKVLGGWGPRALVRRPCRVAGDEAPSTGCDSTQVSSRRFQEVS